jgi:outer membrane receptor protein involved in Fe transport
MFALSRRHAVACTLACVPLAGALPKAFAESTVAPVQVTGTRERTPIAETPASIGIVDASAIELVKPTHPAQLLSQVPGVSIAVTNGEGHSTSIRQPFTTSPVYLFLEDGVPSRATGFFNHNGLYELDIPQSGGIEIVRGPGTALYGSDAIGGIVNVLSRTPPEVTRRDISLEAGGHGWWRMLAAAGAPYADGGVRADVNLTHTDGWREATAYDRRSGIARWDHAPSTAMSTKTIVAFSSVDQETGANSPLVEAHYRDDPRTNYLRIAFRTVDALRVQSALEYQSGRDLFSLTPYFRDNRMELLASFALNFDPTVFDERNRSYGVLAKWRRDFDGVMRPRLIVGADLDISPGERREDAVVTEPSGSGATRRFDDYTIGPRIYDYDVEYRGIAAYVHGELEPLPALRLTAGVRYDHVEYRFDNAFAPSPVRVARPYPGVRFYGQPADATVRFDHASPKLGATYEIGPATHLFASYNHGFRVPSQSQLFRPSAATSAAAADALVQSALALQPIKAAQAEVGLRGNVGPLR